MSVHNLRRFIQGFKKPISVAATANEKPNKIKIFIGWAVIAQWIRLRLPSPVPCSNPKYTSIPSAPFPFIVYCTIFVIAMRKGRK